MKKNIFLRNLFILLIVSLLTNCTKNFEETNKNPNFPDVTPSSTLFTAGCERTANILGSKLNYSYLECWSQQFAKFQYIDEDRYDFNMQDINLYWRRFYSDILSNFERIIQNSSADGNENRKAVAQIMKVYVFSIMTDLWGDIPYSQALKGVLYQYPKYDSQREIYFDLINQLKTASETIHSENGIIDGDIVYGGDTLKWKKFANSLLLRLYIRISAVEPTISQQGIEAILNNPETYPVFESNDDDAQVNYPNNSPYLNPLYEYTQMYDEHGVSKTLIDTLLHLSDPRVDIYALPVASDTTYRGIQNGLPNSELIQFNTVSRIGEKFCYAPYAPIFFMQYSELMFILAEAALNGWNTNISAKEAYEKGIIASMEKSEVDYTTYMENPEVNFELLQNQREAIGVQKWIALYSQGSEAFAEFRRTGFPPTIKEVPASVYPGMGVPYRLPYPSDEFSLNNENVTSASTEIVNFMFGKKMWWTKLKIKK